MEINAMDKFVNLVMPVYNSQDNLRETLSSVLYQTYKKWKLIIVDDGSKDQSGLICDEYARKDPRITVIHTVNGGVSAARNKALSRVTEDYLMFIDSDDQLVDNAIEIAINSIEETDLLIFGYLTIPSNIEQAVKKTKIFNSYTELGCNYKELADNHLLNSPWNKLYKVSIIRNNKLAFDMDMSLGEDLLFNLSYLKVAGKIKVIPNILYYYKNDNSLSLTNRIREDALDIQKLIKEQIDLTFVHMKEVEYETSLVFARYTIEEMKRVVYSKLYSRTEKKAFLRKWMGNSTFLNSVDTIGLKNLPINIIDRYAIKNRRESILYISYRFRGFVTKILQS